MSSRISQLDLVPRRSGEVVARRNPDGTVAIMHLHQEEHLYTLDGIAAELWTLIDGKRSLAQIMTNLTRKHSPPRKQFEADVLKLLRNLRKADLLATN